MKTFNYEDISKNVAEQIKSLMADAEKHRRDGDMRAASLYEGWAYGAYLMWDNLTLGWRTDGDGERMRELTERPESDL